LRYRLSRGRLRDSNWLCWLNFDWSNCCSWLKLMIILNSLGCFMFKGIWFLLSVKLNCSICICRCWGCRCRFGYRNWSLFCRLRRLNSGRFWSRGRSRINWFCFNRLSRSFSWLSRCFSWLSWSFYGLSRSCWFCCISCNLSRCFSRLRLIYFGNSLEGLNLFQSVFIRSFFNYCGTFIENNNPRRCSSFELSDNLSEVRMAFINGEHIGLI
jgi:hypothetical protein